MDSDWLFLLVLGWLFQADSNKSQVIGKGNVFESNNIIVRKCYFQCVVWFPVGTFPLGTENIHNITSFFGMYSILLRRGLKTISNEAGAIFQSQGGLDTNEKFFKYYAYSEDTMELLIRYFPKLMEHSGLMTA